MNLIPPDSQLLSIRQLVFQLVYVLDFPRFITLQFALYFVELQFLLEPNVSLLIGLMVMLDGQCEWLPC